MAITKTVTTSVITRAWNEIEPKLIAVLATGLTATGLIQYGDILGVHLSAEQAGLAVLIVSAIAGYIKSSTSKVPVEPPVAPVVAPAPADPAAPVA